VLSPACASYDMFKNFADRGRRFKVLVEELDA
jgi:UDP-N-acetylmuramoylalanine-D-glutamate ligase